VIAAVVGGALAVTGVVLVATHTERGSATDTRVDVGVSRGGLLVTLGGTW
jgi:hypothetical protein